MRVYAVIACSILLAGCPKKNTDADGGTTTTSTTTAGGGTSVKGLLLGAIASGQVDLLFKNEKGSGTGSIYLKGTKQRMDFQMPDQGSKSAAVIVDGDAKKMTMLDDSTKTAIVMTLDNDGKPQGSVGPTAGGAGGGPMKDHEYKKTGKKDVVAGYECEIWTYEEPDSKGEVCVADGLTMLGMSKLGSFASALSTKMSGFPLRAISFDKAGKEKDRMEVTKLEKKDVSEDKFQVPAGYKIMNMDDMMKGLGGLGRPPRR